MLPNLSICGQSLLAFLFDGGITHLKINGWHFTNLHFRVQNVNFPGCITGETMGEWISRIPNSVLGICHSNQRWRSTNRIWASRTWSLKFAAFGFPLTRRFGRWFVFFQEKWEGKISFQISLRIYGCCKIWWIAGFFWPTFPFASIEASALRNKPSRETGVN